MSEMRKHETAKVRVYGVKSLSGSLTNPQIQVMQDKKTYKSFDVDPRSNTHPGHPGHHGHPAHHGHPGLAPMGSPMGARPSPVWNGNSTGIHMNSSVPNFSPVAASPNVPSNMPGSSLASAFKFCAHF